MKFSFFALAPLLATFVIGLAHGSPGQEFDNRFNDKITKYIHSGVIELKVGQFATKDFTPELWDTSFITTTKDPRLTVRIDACHLRDKVSYKLAEWTEIKDYFRLRTKGERRKFPSLKSITVEKEQCVLVGLITSKMSRIKEKSVSISISELMTRKRKAVNLNQIGSYVKVSTLMGVLPSKKNLGVERIGVASLLEELLMKEPELEVPLYVIKDLELGIKFALRNSDSLSKLADQEVLTSKNNPLFILDTMAKDRELLSLFYSDAGVWEKYSIKEHTLRVMELLDEQYACVVDLEFEHRMSQKLNLPLKNFMQLTMAFHDIGKPLAISAGNKHLQHEFTRPVMDKSLRKLNLSDDAIAVALELTDNDIFGDLLKGNISEAKAIESFKDQRAKTFLTIEEFFRLQSLFYTSDAGAYPSLYDRVFTSGPDGLCIRPKSPKFEKFKSRILNLVE